MITTYNSVPAIVKLEGESTNSALMKKRVVILPSVSFRPQSNGLKDCEEVHFAIPDNFRNSFAGVAFRLEGDCERFQTSCENWVVTYKTNHTLLSVFLIVKY